jgi:predicted DNA-binding transcriptional regulator AlpA
VRAEIPKSESRRKGDKFLSLSEACEMVGVKPTTYRRYEGSLFPKARRMNNHFRIITYEDVEALRKIWNGTG